MKKLLILLMILLPMVAEAQRVDKPGEPYEVYSEVSFSSGSYIIVDVGQDSLQLGFRLCNEQGEPLKSKGFQHTASYLGKRGWVFVKETRPDDYVFKKNVKNDKEVMAGLVFRSKSNKKK